VLVTNFLRKRAFCRVETRSQLSQNKLKKGDLGGQTLPKKARRTGGGLELELGRDYKGRFLGSTAKFVILGTRLSRFWSYNYNKALSAFRQLVVFHILQFPGNRVPIQT
jgi:hypothetical protein